MSGLNESKADVYAREIRRLSEKNAELVEALEQIRRIAEDHRDGDKTRIQGIGIICRAALPRARAKEDT